MILIFQACFVVLILAYIEETYFHFLNQTLYTERCRNYMFFKDYICDYGKKYVDPLGEDRGIIDK